jgi:hypothetical protein
LRKSTATKLIKVDFSRKEKFGAPGPTRTGDLLLRRQMLYPPELQARVFENLEQFTKREGFEEEAASWKNSPPASAIIGTFGQTILCGRCSPPELQLRALVIPALL